ncbi:hypothetical protein ACWDNT_31625, partial [Streptomyces sp. NPDC000963]
MHEDGVVGARSQPGEELIGGQAGQRQSGGLRPVQRGAPATWLNRKHTIFGEVVDKESRKVVDAIAGT